MNYKFFLLLFLIFSNILFGENSNNPFFEKKLNICVNGHNHYINDFAADSLNKIWLRNRPIMAKKLKDVFEEYKASNNNFFVDLIKIRYILPGEKIKRVTYSNADNPDEFFVEAETITNAIALRLKIINWNILGWKPKLYL